MNRNLISQKARKSRLKSTTHKVSLLQIVNISDWVLMRHLWSMSSFLVDSALFLMLLSVCLKVDNKSWPKENYEGGLQLDHGRS